ncbi:MAG TPA: hypothetical protein VMT15_07875 [Bryobacteraceae bacterium]|nr:hypothetical protein [Bryobacteraceae bacterium]
MDRPWLWPNLLSLDAPIVALLWQILFARCFHVPVDPLPSILLVLAVWLIYAADRTIDSITGAGSRPRHEFYRRYWRALLPLWILALAVGLALAWTRLNREMLLHGCALSVAVVVYFALLHLGSLHKTKEAAVAVLFALGATISAWPNVRAPVDVAAIALFSCLCWINCVAIERWESESRWPVAGAAAVVAAGAVPLVFSGRPILGVAVSASALCFVLLDRARQHFSRDALRVLADVALLSPVFLLPVAGLRF